MKGEDPVNERLQEEMKSDLSQWVEISRIEAGVWGWNK